jgi:transposase
LRGWRARFLAFGGVPRKVLLDNARALILHHDPARRRGGAAPRLLIFAQHWRFQFPAFAPYLARTKGKDEQSAGYVQKTPPRGADFPVLPSWRRIWRPEREIADRRMQGTTELAPANRFARDERQARRPLTARRPSPQPTT